MQGRTQSSLSIWTAFNSMTTAVVRTIKFAVKIAWTRVQDTKSFALVGSATVGGNQVVKGLTPTITPSDNFLFFDETDDVISVEYDRQLLEPLGGLAMAILNVTLSNIDRRYTPEVNSTIGTAILPNRPTQAMIGFEVGAINKLVHVFKGLTLMPKESKVARTVEIEGLDYIKFLNEQALESTIYENQRSDQIIEDILTTAGLGSSQYSLDQGKNTIAFAWFTKGQTAGERIKKLCEAEDAVFYQDENGLLRFENRNHYGQSPYNTVIWDVEPSHILAWKEDNSTKIINRVIVSAKPRQVTADNVEVWLNGIEEQIEAGETITIWAELENPLKSLVTPVETTDYTAFTDTGGAGTDISSDITITTTLFTTTVKIEIENANASKAYLNFLRLRGKPALITSEIKKTAEDATSISKYGESQFTLDNDFIDDEDFAEYIANAIVSKYADPTRRLVLTVQGVPQLQLRDMVRVKDQDVGTYKNYRVMRIQGKLDQGAFVQELTLREVTDAEYDNYAIVGSSTVGGSDVVSP